MFSASATVMAMCLTTRPSGALINAVAWASGGDLWVLREEAIDEESWVTALSLAISGDEEC